MRLSRTYFRKRIDNRADNTNFCSNLPKKFSIVTGVSKFLTLSSLCHRNWLQKV